MFQLSVPLVVYYHANCPDGHAAAFLIWLWAKERDLLDQVTFKPAQYGFPAHVQPEGQYGMKPDSCDDLKVIILDFSFPLDVTLKMIEQVKSLLVIDHHDTAERILTEIPEKNKIFDMTKCGSMLTYQFIYDQLNTEKYPYLNEFLEYIQDRDLWIESSKRNWVAFNLGFCADSMTFETTYKIVTVYDSFKQVEVSGVYLQMAMNERIKKAEKGFLFGVYKDPLGEGNIVIATCNTTNDLSDIADYALKKYPFIDLFGGFYLDCITKETQWSFRSKGYPSNKLSEYLAKQYNGNGGGHPKASACRFKNIQTELPLTVIETKAITHLAKGNKYDILDNHVCKDFLVKTFPDLITVVNKEFRLIRNDQTDSEKVFHSIDELLKEIQPKIGDIITCTKSGYGEAVIYGKDMVLQKVFR